MTKRRCLSHEEAKHCQVEFPTCDGVKCCGVCGRVPKYSDNTHPLRFCASCRNMHRYCDRACQLRGWNEHKILCRMTCSYCSQIWSSNLPKCECELRRYCNTRCQELDWGAWHKRTCTFSTREDYLIPNKELLMHNEQGDCMPATSKEDSLWSAIWRA